MTRGTFAYVAQRFVLIALTALVVSSIVFIGVHQLPGNAFLSERQSSPQREAELLHHYGLDKPLPEQYLAWVGGVLHGDLGESLVNRGVPIAPLVLRELTVSAEVGVFALVFTIGLGMVLGVVAAIRQNTWVDYVLSTTSVIGYSMPSFVVATFLLLVFAVWLDNLTQGTFYFQIGWTGTYGTIGEIWLPAFALGFPYASIVARLTRASMLEVIRQDYIRTARAKGLPERTVVYRHALRNAMIPILTVLGLQFGALLAGAIVTETIFSWPGIGRLTIQAIANRDYYLVQGCILAIGLTYVAVNFLTDLLYSAVNPRIRQ